MKLVKNLFKYSLLSVVVLHNTISQADIYTDDIEEAIAVKDWAMVDTLLSVEKNTLKSEADFFNYHVLKAQAAWNLRDITRLKRNLTLASKYRTTAVINSFEDSIFQQLTLNSIFEENDISLDLDETYLLFSGNSYRSHKSIDGVLKDTNTIVNKYLEGTMPDVDFISIKAPVLERDEFETTVDFEKRLERSADEYIKALSFLRAQKTAMIKSALSRKNNRHKLMDYKQRKTLQLLMNEELASPQLSHVFYDADREVFSARLSTELIKGKIKKHPIEIAVPRHKAKVLKPLIQSSEPIIIYGLESNKLSFDDVVLVDNKNNTAWKAEFVDFETHKPKPITLPEAAPFNIDSQLMTILEGNYMKANVIASSLDIEIQKLKAKKEQNNLTPSVVRRIENEISRLQRFGENKYVDDLPKLLAKVKPAKIKEHHYALVIGIDNYAKNNSVEFAENSATIFSKTLNKVMGVPQQNIYLLTGENATSSGIRTRIKSIVSRLENNSRLYFYYAGHGIPNQQDNGQPFILPYDGDVGFVHLDEYMQVNTLLNELSSVEGSQVVSFLDSCFSGNTDNKFIFDKGVAPGLVRRSTAEIPSSNFLLFSAGNDQQFANSYRDKGHRLFSYYVIKSLISGNKNPESILRYVTKNVKSNSLAIGPIYEQTPQLRGRTSFKGDL